MELWRQSDRGGSVGRMKSEKKELTSPEGCKIMLPSSRTIPVPRRFASKILKQVVASCAPESPGCIVAALVHNPKSTKLVFRRIRDESWTLIKDGGAEHEDFLSIAFHNNKLYAVNRYGREYIMIFRFGESDSTTVTSQRLITVLNPPRYNEFIDAYSLNGFKFQSDYDSYYLGVDQVEGEVFMVIQRVDKYIPSNRSFFPCSRAKGFEVFKLDLNGPRWTPVNDLGDRLLLLDCKGVKEDSNTPLVINVLASLIERNISRTERIVKNCSWALSKSIRTNIFDSREIPDMTIQSYLERIFRYTRAGPSVYVVAYVYIDRFCHNNPEFRINASNVHRLLITTIMVASKYVEDMNYRNSYFARVGGLKTNELNELEVEFLFLMGFKLHVNVSVFESYCCHLEREVSIGGGYHIERTLRCAEEMKTKHREERDYTHIIARVML
ncbi:cyclin-U2-1-like [Senna tora]|uniref:Cyclin-U2-1-like n=1 Tax=Senna tora TaxID=362788 RepID=A0A834TW35_9FABA|nr:cyclin-U2-1-like [Senna tora]